MNSIESLAPWSSVQITWSLFIISTSEGHSIIPAVTVEGPSTVKFIFFTPLKSNFTLIPLTFKIISVRSSLTPGIEENS